MMFVAKKIFQAHISYKLAILFLPFSKLGNTMEKKMKIFITYHDMP